ncbi:8671_t:CDS:2, partial [Racocetra persica]
ITKDQICDICDRQVTVDEVRDFVEASTSQEATAFAEYLIRIGNGTKPTIENDLIRLPDKIIINSRDDKDNISTLLEAVYPNLTENAIDIKFITERAILTLLNCDIDRINKQIVENFLGEQCTYYSFNTLPDDNLNLYPIEYLNSLMPQELPLHELILKVGAPVMLLRNLDPDNSLCNGMKLICHGLQTYMIDTEI